ncbi:MAG: L-lactate dehydrogenase [Candidatus Kaiserbacteria bacterium]|nr:L-lactate dehydrogenase [Candidatus Kaiserbacteria bacterium]
MNTHAEKIAVIGAGSVGSTVAYTLLLKNLASEIVLIDVNETREEGEVMDMHDALPFVETGEIKRGDFKDASDADIIIITAGLPQKSGETRLDLTKKNKDIVQSIFAQITQIKESAIIIMVTNPVDVMTFLAQEVSGLAKNQVLGTGTGLDTARLKSELSEMLNVNASDVEGFVLGEHGDSGFIAWSTVKVGGSDIKKVVTDPAIFEKIENDVKQEAYNIISKKGATFYGIASVVADLVQTILLDENKIIAVSTLVDNWNGVNDICMGVPSVINRSGVKELWNIELEPSEIEKLQKSAEILKGYLS